MQEVFCGVPTGKVVANEFKGSTKKKVFLYLLRSGGKTYVKVSNNQLRYSWNSLRPCLQHIRYTLLSVNHRKFSLNRARKKYFNISLVLLNLPLRGCKFWPLSISSETNM